MLYKLITKLTLKFKLNARFIIYFIISTALNPIMPHILFYRRRNRFYLTFRLCL